MLLLFWPNNKKTEEKIVENPAILNREDRDLPIELPKIQRVSWQLLDNIDLPKTSRLVIQKQTIDETRSTKIKETLGINDKNGYVDKENNIVGYTEEIVSVKQVPTKGSWEIELLKNKLKKITENINEEGEMEIKWTGVEYKKILYPRWIDSTEVEAQGVEISGDYVVGGVKLTTYYGESIKGTFNREGRLLKLVVSLKPEVVSSGDVVELINIDQASKSPINMYGAMNNAGIENIEKVNITQTEIVYVYSNKKSLIKPYYLLSGNTYSENKPLKILLLLKAEK